MEYTSEPVNFVILFCVIMLIPIQFIVEPEVQKDYIKIEEKNVDENEIEIVS